MDHWFGVGIGYPSVLSTLKISNPMNMKTLKSFPRFLAILSAATAFSSTASAQVSLSGVYKGTVANGGPILIFSIEERNEIEVHFVDPAARTAGEAEGRLTTDRTFSLTTGNSISIAGTVSSDGSMITGTFTSGTSAQPYTATRIQPTSQGSQAAGIYTGPATNTTAAAATVTFTIDPAANVTFIQKTGSGASATIVGAVGTITQTQVSPPTYSFSLSPPTAVVASVTGTFTLTGGTIAGTYTLGADTYAFTAFKSRLVSRLVNISTRGFVNTGQGQLIGGFVIKGGTKQVLIIARGPSLTAFGVSPVLPNPKITLYSGPIVIGSNAGWKNNTNLPSLLNMAFTATLVDNDSALLVSLEPGPYTSVVTSADGTSTGIALVEVYEASWE